MGVRVGDHALTWEQRFWSRVEKTDGCWIWHGGRGGTPTNPYGVYMEPGQHRRGAHVIAYELAVGPIPAELHIDHLCVNTLCVNPEHLEPVTRAENRRRQSARKTHCKNDHPLSGDNLYVDRRGHRSCVICRRTTSTRCQRERRARERAA